MGFGAPGLRQSRDALLVVLCLVAAGYCFGASGVALGVLWWRARAAALPCQAAQADMLDPDQLLDSPTLKLVHLTPWRALFVDDQLGRHEIFVDEVTAPVWARLRRRAIALEQR